MAKNFLHEYELDALRDFAQHRLKRSLRTYTPNVLATLDKYNVIKTHVNNETQYARLTTIALYLSWFTKYLLGCTRAEDMDRIHTLREQIKVRRPVKKGRNKVRDRSLDNVQVDALFEVIRMGSEINPFNPKVQRRNRLMILMLYHLGIRGGELLNIRISDFDFNTNRVSIVRRADEKKDPRPREPNTKTLERILPIADSLVRDLHDYIVKDRRNVPNAKTNDYLFVTHKEGPTLGQPISKSGYRKILIVVSAVLPQLYAVTGHKLRHTWNRKFSEKMDTMDIPLSEERQEQIRSYLMGWKQNSGTATNYNKRFIEQKGLEAALSLQENCGVRTPKGK